MQQIRGEDRFYAGALLPLNCSLKPSILLLRTQNKPRSCSLFHPVGGKKGSKKKRKSERSRATMETRNSFAVQKGVVLPANSLIAAFVRVSLLTAVLSPRSHFAIETALDVPRLLQCKLPIARFERMPPFARRFGKVEFNFNTKLSQQI